MENKLIDNEILKALEKCASIGESCEGCPFYDYTDCDSRLKEEFHNFIKRKDAEIERLEKANESFSDMGKLYSEIKSEARKEYAERLKVHAYYISFPKEHRVVDEDDIDNLVKELTE